MKWNSIFSTSLFKIIMHSNHILKLDPPLVCNPIIRPLFKVTSYCLLQNVDFLNILHWYFCSYDFRKCKRWVLIVNLFIHESKLCNWLSMHLDLVMRMFAWDHYNLNIYSLLGCHQGLQRIKWNMQWIGKFFITSISSLWCKFFKFFITPIICNGMKML